MSQGACLEEVHLTNIKPGEGLVRILFETLLIIVFISKGVVLVKVKLMYVLTEVAILCNAFQSPTRNNRTYL